MKSVIYLLITAMFINNVVIYFGCGSALILSARERISAILKGGLLTTIGMFLVCVFCSVVKIPVLFRTPAAIIFALLIWIIIFAVCDKVSFFYNIENYLGIYLLDSGIIAVYMYNARNNYNIIENMIIGIGFGLGCTLVTLIIGALMEKLENRKIPKAFKGLPLLMITYGFIAMAFSIF